MKLLNTFSSPIKQSKTIFPAELVEKVSLGFVFSENPQITIFSVSSNSDEVKTDFKAAIIYFICQRESFSGEVLERNCSRNGILIVSNGKQNSDQ